MVLRPIKLLKFSKEPANVEEWIDGILPKGG